MRGFNKAIIAGHCGSDPEVRTMPSGGQVANVSIATTEKWTDAATNAPKEKTTWHRLTFYNKLAEIVAKHVKKGDPILVEGKIDISEYTDKENVKRYSTQIICNSMQFLGSSSDNQQGNNPAANRTSVAPAGGEFELVNYGGVPQGESDIGALPELANEAEKRLCGFDVAWRGSCKNDHATCDHRNTKCRCGKPAVRTCDHTYSLVCGSPLCADCYCNCSDGRRDAERNKASK